MSNAYASTAVGSPWIVPLLEIISASSIANNLDGVT